MYRVEFLSQGRRPVVKTHRSETPLVPGEMIAVDGDYLVVEWVRPDRLGDPHEWNRALQDHLGTPGLTD